MTLEALDPLPMDQAVQPKSRPNLIKVYCIFSLIQLMFLLHPKLSSNEKKRKYFCILF